MICLNLIRCYCYCIYVGESTWMFKIVAVQKLSICWERKAYQMKRTFIRKRKCIHKVTWFPNRFFTNEDLKDVPLHTPRKFFKIMKKKLGKFLLGSHSSSYGCHISSCTFLCHISSCKCLISSWTYTLIRPIIRYSCIQVILTLSICPKGALFRHRQVAWVACLL